MLTYLTGIAFLIACVLGVPLLRRILLERLLRDLEMDGVTVVPRFWRPSGLRIRRPGWEGDVRFESAGLGNNNRRGHLRLRAEFKGDRPPAPELLQRLDQLGGRVSAQGDGALEIDGPLPKRTADLKSFLELCDAIVQGTVVAAGG